MTFRTPLALLSGVAALSGHAHAALVTITPNADFSTTPYDLSFDGGATTSYTFFDNKSANGGALNTYANSVKGTNAGGTPVAIATQGPPSLPFDNPSLTSGSNVILFQNQLTGDQYYGLQFSLDGNTFDGYADVRNTFDLISVTYDDTPIPEPASLALLATGAAGLLAMRRRQAAGGK